MRNFHLRLTLFTMTCAAYSGMIGNSGEEAFAFLENFQGAKNLALGGINLSADQGPNQIFQNPAGVALANEGFTFAGNHAFSTADIHQSSLTGIYQGLAFAHGFGMSIKQFGEIEERDVTGEKSGLSHSPFHAVTTYNLSWQGGKNWRVGHQLQWVWSKIADGPSDQTAQGFTGGIGINWQLPAEEIDFATSIVHLGRQTSAYTSNGVDDLWTNAKWKMAVSSRANWAPRLRWHLGLDLPFYGEERLILAGDYTQSNWFSWQIGLRPSWNHGKWLVRKTSQQKTNNLRLREEWPAQLGFEIRTDLGQINYALLPDAVQPWWHQLQWSLSAF